MLDPRLRHAPLFLLVFALLLPRIAHAQTLDERGALERFFTAPELFPSYFGSSFLAAVPFDQIGPLRTRMIEPLGAFEEVRRDGDRWLAVFEFGSIPTLAEVDAEGRFTGLRLLPAIKRVQAYEELIDEFDALPGVGALLVVVEGEDRLAYAADTPFAVGSAFKFVVLRALVTAIEGGYLHWDQVVELRPEYRTLPTGTLSQWPDGSPVTLHTLAALMISESDNTATDALIRVVGRESVEAADPSGRNRPFLTTLEAFQLKDHPNEAWLDRWRASGEDEKRVVLSELPGRSVPPVTIFSEGPRATDVEWYFTARELCGLVDELSWLDLLTINPGVVSRSQFARVAFKGGSEPGVLNLTTWVRTEDGREACVCATRNAKTEIDTVGLAGIVGAAFELVRKR